MSKKRIMGKKAKSTACILTAGMMIMSAGVFTGCGGSGSNTAIVDQQEAMKTLAYKVADIGIDFEISGNVVSKNGLFYAGTFETEMKGDHYFSNSNLIVFDSTGNITLTIPVYVQENANDYGGIQGTITVDDNGNITVMKYTGWYDEETGDNGSTNILVTYDSTGKEISSIDMGGIVTEEDQNNNRWLNNYLVDKAGNIYLNLGTCVRVCDSTGKILFTTEDMNNENSWINGMIMTNSGIPAICIYEYIDDKSSCKLKEIDINTKGFGKEYQLPTSAGNLYDGGGDYLCYFSSDTGVTGVRADTATCEQVINLLNLGVNNSYISSFCANSDGSFVTVGNDYSSYESKTILNHIVPVDSSEVKEKSIISLGCFYLDWNIRSAIADFNKTNENYTIYATSYADTNDTSDYYAAQTKFNNEILAGNVPDILLIDSSMPFDSYASKGLFADLYEVIESDSELTKDSFLPNVLRAMERDGKLLAITPNFSIQTYAAKKSLVGDVQSITMDKAKEIMASMGENVSLTAYDATTSATEFLQNAVMFSNFVDYENASCSFDSPEFKAVLEMAKTFPVEVDYDAFYNENPNYWMEMETACRDNKALLYSSYLSDFTYYNSIRDASFGEDITFVGFPTASADGKGGSLLNCGTQLAISEKSKFKEGAWEFISGIIKNAVIEEEVPNYSNTTYSNGVMTTEASADGTSSTKKKWVSQYYGLPVLKDQMKLLADQALIPDTYIDENGEEVVSENIYYVGDQEIKISLPTQADVDMLMEFYSSVDRTYNYDESLFNIINEDANAFFSGTKSVDETAAIIQSRVSIYLSEQY